MKYNALLLVFVFAIYSIGCGNTKSTTKTTTTTTTTKTTKTSTSTKTESGDKVDLAKFVGDYTAQDECNGDFGYTIQIRQGTDNNLLITGLGTFPHTVSATIIDNMQFSITDYENTKDGETINIKGVGNATRDKTTGTIALSYHISDNENIDATCKANLVKQ